MVYEKEFDRPTANDVSDLKVIMLSLFSDKISNFLKITQKSHSILLI